MGNTAFLRLFLEAKEKLPPSTKAMYTKVSWLEGNFPAGLPIAPKRRQWP